MVNKFADILTLKDKYYGVCEAGQIALPSPVPVNTKPVMAKATGVRPPVASKPLVKKSPHELEIEKIQKQAEKIKAMASRLKAKNEYKKAKIESDNIDSDNKEEAVYPHQPAPEQPAENVEETYSDSPGIGAAPMGTGQDLEEDYSDSPGIGGTNQPFDIDEELDYDSSDGNMDDVPILESIQQLLFEQDEPQTKEEADIAKTQAETEKIRAEAEAASNPEDPTAEADRSGEEDPMGEDPMEGEDPMGGAGADPMADPGSMGAMGDPMAGMPGQADPNDPMGGFGDSTAPGADDGGMGMGGMGMGMGGETPQKTTTALGRLFIIKKLHFRLAAINHLLVNSTDPELTEISDKVAEVFDIFKLVVNNLKSFKGKIDEVIVMFYQFIREVCKVLHTHYKGKYQEEPELE